MPILGNMTEGLSSNCNVFYNPSVACGDSSLYTREPLVRNLKLPAKSEFNFQLSTFNFQFSIFNSTLTLEVFTMLFDTHAHMNDEAFDTDREQMILGLPDKGIQYVMNVGCSLHSSGDCIAMAEKYPFVYASVGTHPDAASEVNEEVINTYRQMAKHPRVLAIGEIGLDYYWEDNAPREVQVDWCRKQIELAQELGLPVILHDREAHEDTLNLIREYRPCGVVHCFSGSAEMARQITDLGMYIGLGGATTFKNARKPVEVAAALPADRLLLETDAPYMAPVPCRGHRCDSAMIAHTAARIAEIRGVDADTLLEQTRRNANTLFGLDF